MTSASHDIELELPQRPGALADMGEAFARIGVNVEGGGAWVVDGRGVAHFLVDDGEAARRALAGTGITVRGVRAVLVQRLDQQRPGQLGALCRRMASAGVDILAQYSDHDHRLILVVDDIERGHAVSSAWERERRAAGGGQPPSPSVPAPSV